MKAPAFDYVKPRNLSEVFDLLAQHGDDARILAAITVISAVRPLAWASRRDCFSCPTTFALLCISISTGESLC